MFSICSAVGRRWNVFPHAVSLSSTERQHTTQQLRRTVDPKRNTTMTSTEYRLRNHELGPREGQSMPAKQSPIRIGNVSSCGAERQLPLMAWREMSSAKNRRIQVIIDFGSASGLGGSIKPRFVGQRPLEKVTFCFLHGVGPHHTRKKQSPQLLTDWGITLSAGFKKRRFGKCSEKIRIGL